MRYRVRTIAPQPSGASSQEETRTWILEQGAHGFLFTQSVIVGGNSQPATCSAVSALGVRSSYGDEKLIPSLLFEMLRGMPHLQDLTIDVSGAHPASLPAGLLSLPCRLRRLALCPIFPGCADLIRGSSETLECLVLCRTDSGQTYSDVFRNVPFAQFHRLRSLRLQGIPDLHLLSVCGHVRSLSLCLGAADLALCVRHPLDRLTLVYWPFDGDAALALARALSTLPNLAGLRILEIEINDGEDFSLSGHPGKKGLADVCRTRRIHVSVLRTRAPAEWDIRKTRFS